MENIFQNAYFGKAYKTRDEKKALYVKYNKESYDPDVPHQLVYESTGNLMQVDNQGNFWKDKESDFDIISEWKEEIDEEKLDALAVRFAKRWRTQTMTKETIDIIIEWFAHIEQLGTDRKTQTGVVMDYQHSLDEIAAMASRCRQFVEKYKDEQDPILSKSNGGTAMTKEEYKSKLEALKDKYHYEINSLKKSYAFSNNPVKVGDIITDHYHSIKVEKVMLSSHSIGEYPSCFYIGVQIKKDGTPFSKQKDTEMWQHNVRYINGQPIGDTKQ